MTKRRGAGPFIESALTGARLDYYVPRTQPWGKMPEGYDKWSNRVNGILARQKGRHDHDATRPEKVDALAFVIAVHDVDDLLTLLMTALYEEQVQKVFDAKDRA